MSDYRDEIRLGKEVLARTVEAYRKIRNTFRYLLANLYDFDPATRRACPCADCWRSTASCWRATRGWPTTCCAPYAAYDFQAIFHAINEFVTVDLSAFYLDVSKDRLYTFRADSRERRSAQTAQYLIADGLTRLIAPILSMTADEIWRQLPGTREESVHLADFPRARDELAGRRARDEWQQLLDVRATVNAALEVARQQKEIGSALGGARDVASGARRRSARRARADLPMLFITSAVDVHARARRRASRSGRARAGRQVPALLAVRDRRGARRRDGRPVRALRGRHRRRGCLPAGDESPRRRGRCAAGRRPGRRRSGLASSRCSGGSRLASSSADQITKALVDARCRCTSSRTIIPDFIDLVHVQNAGVAFGLLNSARTSAQAESAHDGAGRARARRHRVLRAARPADEERLARLGLSLILGGAVGNLIDRMRQGYVIDFVDVYWRDWHFWAFNVADAAISVGATLVFVECSF